MSDDTKNSNDEKSKVASIKDARAKKEEAKEKLSKNDAYLAIARAINRDKYSTLPEFQGRYHVVEVAPGVRRVLEELPDKTVRYVHDNAVTSAILVYTINKLRGRYQGYGFEYRHAKSAMDYWLGSSDAIPEPKAVAWINDEELAFNRLPWVYEPVPRERTPVFNELLGRMSNAEAVRLWIGSLFVPEADREQYVWLFGEGQNGKGSLAYFLSKVFGKAYRSVQPPAPGDKHWTAGLLGSRLVVFSDCNAYGFPTSGLFKSLTGNDLIPIDEKFMPKYSAELNCKFMFLSNAKPNVTSSKSDVRRAIYSEVSALPDGIEPSGRVYREQLQGEGGAFLSTCIHSYLTAYPHHGPIKVDRSDLDDVIEENEAHYDVVARRCFDFSSPTFSCWASDLQEVLTENFRDKKEQREFRAYLTRRYGIGKSKCKKRSSDGSVGKIYEGIKRKTTWRGDYYDGATE